jgi:hypothetical protein
MVGIYNLNDPAANELLPGMTQAMITAARLIAHKSINGKYQSLMQMDQMDNLGQYVLPLFFEPYSTDAPHEAK